MTERKPLGQSFESWIDKQIREATERGEFDNLPGAGKPIPGAGRPDDENWWVRNYLHREGVSGKGMLPTSLQLKKDVEDLPATLATLTSERAVRDAVDKLNVRIRDWLRIPTGPHVHLTPLDVDDLVERWRTRSDKRAG